MNGAIFRQLNIPVELATEFLAVFSRMEYALKSTEFADGGPARVDPAWDRFANHIHERFTQLEDEHLAEAAKFLLEQRPRKQVLRDGRLQFVEQELEQGQRSTQQLLKMVRTVRNNLFHGGKYSPDGEVELGRNEHLIAASLEILKQCRRLHEGVLNSYER
ncbi:hypothetical protein [Halopseudomonas salegens]|uniref:Apea-like HEPN domain-containing protein n=1 Tax=Halopseudomonas salegens TaxID=1434072 RepID=A0A1H2G9G2_9GAMM|nr:hypothetical protein [Halopseudomonas salegens]SDU16172.1 hypothetical protein SAMN05216210_2136 [Halopseudomonas salegens]